MTPLSRTDGITYESIPSKGGSGAVLNHIRGPREDWSMFVGKVEEINERISKERGFRWTIDAQVSLSEGLRNRVLAVTVSPPTKQQKQPLSFVSQNAHREYMDYQQKQGQGQPFTQHAFFMEDARFKSKLISDAYRGQHISSIDGAIRRIEDACETTYPDGKPVNPLIRVMLEVHYGVCMDFSAFRNAEVRNYLRLWIKDIVDFTEGQGRHRYWSPRDECYVYDPQRCKRVPMDRIPMSSIYGTVPGQA